MLGLVGGRDGGAGEDERVSACGARPCGAHPRAAAVLGLLVRSRHEHTGEEPDEELEADADERAGAVGQGSGMGCFAQERPYRESEKRGQCADDRDAPEGVHVAVRETEGDEDARGRKSPSEEDAGKAVVEEIEHCRERVSFLAILGR